MPRAGQFKERQTAQRDAIAAVIRAAAGPLSVDQIHHWASRRRRGLGIATVYRTVKWLLESGRIKLVMLPDGQARYEAADLGHHHHFRCRVCQGVFDLDLCPVSMPAGSTLPGGFQVEGHELTLYGTCPDCGEERSPPGVGDLGKMKR